MSDDQVGPAEYDDSDEEEYVNRDSVMSAERQSRQFEQEQHERHEHHEHHDKKHHEERHETTEDMTEVSQSLGNQLQSSKLQVLEESYQPPSHISEPQHDQEIAEERTQAIESLPTDNYSLPVEVLKDGTSRVQVEVIPGTEEVSHVEQESHVVQETISVEAQPSVEVQAAQQRDVEQSAPAEEAHFEQQVIPEKTEEVLPVQSSEPEKIPEESHESHHVEHVEDPSHPGHNAQHKQQHQQTTEVHHLHHADHEVPQTQQPHKQNEHPVEHHQAHHAQPTHHEEEEHHQKPEHHEHLKVQTQAEVIPKQEYPATHQEHQQHPEYHTQHAHHAHHTATSTEEHHQQRIPNEPEKKQEVAIHHELKTENAPQPEIEKKLAPNSLTVPKKENIREFSPQPYRPPSILQREERVQVEQVSQQQLKTAQPDTRQKIQIQSIREKPKTQDKNAGRPAACSGCEIM